MKVSELIKEIVRSAEDRFGTDDFHWNDCISVDIYYAPSIGWQVDLYRPTQRQMACGQFDNVTIDTVKVWESTCAFHTEADTLVRALEELQCKVDDADYGDFDPA